MHKFPFVEPPRPGKRATSRVHPFENFITSTFILKHLNQQLTSQQTSRSPDDLVFFLSGLHTRPQFPRLIKKAFIKSPATGSYRVIRKNAAGRRPIRRCPVQLIGFISEVICLCAAEASPPSHPNWGISMEIGKINQSRKRKQNRWESFTQVW